MRKLGLVAALVSTTGVACDGDPRTSTSHSISSAPPTAVPSTAADSPDPLVGTLRKDLIEKMCGEGAYERACFDVDSQRCRDLAAQCFDGCASQHAREISAAGRRSPTEMGVLLGGCTERHYIAELEKLGKVNRKGQCSDPSNFFR